MSGAPFGWPTIPTEFLLFGLTLVGVAVFHRRALDIAVAGLIAVTIYKHDAVGFSIDDLVAHVGHEWVLLANLAGLLLGFSILADHFERSHVPRVLPHFLPSDGRAPFLVLVIVFVLSSFLDNIAGAMIGGTMAHAVFQRVHIGYLAAVVAAANAGGAGSVVGDTTTTMMWLAGVSPLQLLPAYLPATAALLTFGLLAARQQHRHSRAMTDLAQPLAIDWARLAIVGVLLLTAVGVNLVVNLSLGRDADRWPFIGAAIWAVIFLSIPIRRPDWRVLVESTRGTVFLLTLVLIASLMPVEELPAPSWQNTLGLGFVSAVFDNIPITKLALDRGGYDWALLAYSVGFGGSMIWFGSSAGVAVSNLFPEARSTGAWLRHAWHIPIAYVVGFLVMLLGLGWQPAELVHHASRYP